MPVLTLWLQVVGKFELVTCSTTFEAQPFYSRPDTSYISTSLVIFSASIDKVGKQVKKIRLMWPETHLVVP
jgi:hypothetical protein